MISKIIKRTLELILWVFLINNRLELPINNTFKINWVEKIKIFINILAKELN